VEATRTGRRGATTSHPPLGMRPPLAAPRNSAAPKNAHAYAAEARDPQKPLPERGAHAAPERSATSGAGAAAALDQA